MKKFLVLFTLVITIFIICAPYTVAPESNNGEILKKLKEDGKTNLTYVGEYSYVSKAGKITGTDYFGDDKAAVFLSLGRPSISDNINYTVYIGYEKNDIYNRYLKIRTNSGDEYIKTHYPGMIFKKTAEDFSASELEGVDCILDLNDERGGNKIDSFEWLDNVLIKEDHVFGIFTNKGDFGRSTIYGHEWANLESWFSSSFQYKDGWIYYIDSNILYKVKVDGSERVQVYDKDIIDYTLEDERILILKYVSDAIYVYSISYTGGEAQQIASTESDDDIRYNNIIGSIGDTIYLCSKEPEDRFEISSVSAGNVDSVYCTTENMAGLKPFLHNNYIYYITCLLESELHRYDISTGEDSVIAEGLYYVGQAIIG